jgi:hypothetical protein
MGLPESFILEQGTGPVKARRWFWAERVEEEVLAFSASENHGEIGFIF